MKAFWDQRYAEEGFAYGTEVNGFLAQQDALLKPGMQVLCIGEGEGRNAAWLAARGLRVTAVDLSRVGLDKAAALATEAGYAIETICADLATWDWPEGAYDAVVSIFVHLPPGTRAQVHRSALKALKPGGILLLEAFHEDQFQHRTGGPPTLEMLYSDAMLREDFAGGDILSSEEVVAEVYEGKYHLGVSSLVRMIVRRR